MVSAKYIAIGLVTLSSYASAQTARTPDRSADQTEIMRSIAEVSRAYVARDPEPFGRVYLENYASIRGKPVYNAREHLIAMMKADSVPVRAGRKLDFQTLSYESENPGFHFFGQTAIVTIAKKNLWQYRGVKCLTKSQGTELWLKREGAWKIAAAHATTFQCEPRPFYPIHSAVAAIPSLTKGPPNSDIKEEGRIRTVIRDITRPRKPGSETVLANINDHIAQNFIATDLSGNVVNDPAELTKLQPLASGRTPGLRNQDDVVLIYGDVAIFTYRFRPPAAPGAKETDASRQCTLFLVKSQDKWLVAAMHVSKIAND